jgi:protein phosphatase
VVRTAASRLDIGGATSAGRVRDRNEDSFLVKHQVWSNLDDCQELALVVVADGMGGHEAGEQASGLAIRTIGNALTPLLSGALSGQFGDAGSTTLAETLDYALQEANRAVYRKGHGDPACQGMGATAAAVLIWNRRALIGHVGDCRVYHQTAGRLVQVTKDQTLVARMIELGKLSPEEALTHPARHEVTQALGKSFTLQPASYEVKLGRGDWLVAACDGLQAHVEDQTVQKEITHAGPSALSLACRLVELANGRGGTDNCTVIAVRCG